MPGILPMKVIKVGTSSQARIAQACDRCRSKKIRCDGIRPSCSQCTNVGFECKTSDKLSRRAFPRGYTESLEERVRLLETETRELKDLLDAKEEKLDLLARVHSQSPRQSSSLSSRRSSSIQTHASAAETRAALAGACIKIQRPSHSHGTNDSSSAPFAATSNGRYLIDSFYKKLQESARSCINIPADALLSPRIAPPTSTCSAAKEQVWQAPPRVVSDQMVNIFFQEWAPLFPVLHRPTFLATYEQYVSNTDGVNDQKSLAQLNLVFAIAALSSESRISYNVLTCQRQWEDAMSTFCMDTSVVNLQCLLLAIIFCLLQGDYAKVTHYRSLAIGVCHQLGLQQSQKHFSLDALTSETRKKVFWTFYTLDCFSAAALGLPQLLRDDDVACEFPLDVDDEYVTENGFLPSLPGEPTKLSSALALFRASQILSRSLSLLYPCSSETYEIPLVHVNTLNQDLDDWSRSLPNHLRLDFENGKPSANTISSRCPLISLTYHYIRTMIHRPVVCADMCPQTCSSLDALASSSKHMVQIIQLLQERSLGLSICINKGELLLLSSFGILFQMLQLRQDSKLWLEYQQITRVVAETLASQSFPGAANFETLLKCLTGMTQKGPSVDSGDMPSIGAQLALRDLARRYAAAAAAPSMQHQGSGSKTRGEHVSSSTKPSKHYSERRLRPLAPSSSRPVARETQVSPKAKAGSSEGSDSNRSIGNKRATTCTPALNLDYLSFGDEMAISPTSNGPHQSVGPDGSAPGWDYFFKTSSTAGEASGTFGEGVFGWPVISDLVNLSSDGMLEKETLLDAHGATDVSSGHRSHQPSSALSLSDDSLTSGDEFASLDFGVLDCDGASLAMSSNGGSPATLAPPVAAAAAVAP